MTNDFDDLVELAPPEIRFRNGAEAFRAGEPRDPHQHFDWLRGWDSALAGKTTAFRDYRKWRTLQAQDFRSSTWSDEQVVMVRESRARRIARHEAEYPDFRAAYEKLMRMLKR